MRYIILIVCCLLLITSCKKKCSEEASKKSYLDPELDAYFGMFKKGNYWVYENQDKTKRDSLYVTAYDRKFILDRTACDDMETFDFTIKEKYKDVVIVGDSVCCNAKYNELNVGVCTSAGFFLDYLKLLNFYADTIYCDRGIAKNINFVTLNNQMFTNKIIEIYYESDTLYMQQKVGIIGWKKNNDTYNLINKYLQP